MTMQKLEQRTNFAAKGGTHTDREKESGVKKRIYEFKLVLN